MRHETVEIPASRLKSDILNVLKQEGIIVDFVSKNEAVGSTNPKSQHVRGEAADIKGIEVTNFEVASYIYNNLDFDQLILEFVEDEEPKWIHVSYKETGNRKQVLIAMKSKKKTEYILYSPKLSEKIYGKVL
jgi:ribosomal protein S8